MRTQKNNFRTKEQAERFIANYGDEIFSKRGYAPVRAYYNEGCQAWQVTSTYLNAANEYLQELKERDALRVPHNCTKLHMSKLVLKQLLFDIDSEVVKIIDCVKGNVPCDDRKHRLDYLMSIARGFEGEDSHKGRVAKFQLFLKDCCPNAERMASFEDYFNKKVRHYGAASSKNYDNGKRTMKLVYSRFFHLVEAFKDEVECGRTNVAQSLLERAKTLQNEFKDVPLLKYKRKQAEMALLLCEQAC